jgi:phage/plasmid-associated DNA primase
MIEGRILATTNATEKSREQLFFVWNGTSWVQDTSNLVTSVFVSQMGCLLAWYERQRERCLGTLYASRPKLKEFVVGGVLKRLDHEEVNPKQMRKIKMAAEACVKERDQTMPSFGKINVQDPSDVRKCMHFVVTELNVKGLVDLFDQDPTVANAPNGLIDLRTGALLPHHLQDLCNNQTCMYIPGASTGPTARFRTFLMEVLPPTVIEWLQMFLGYCLIGEMSEELFVIANGLSGANGKGVLDEALRKAFGSYYCAGSKAIFIKPSFKANGSSASSHLMQIRTKRLVRNNESKGVKEPHASFLKEATGGGPLQARKLFCKSQSYVPQYKLVLFTNYRPHFPSDDSALLRRLVLMMFNYTFKTPDELDPKNKWHKPIDVSIKEYFESDEGAADTLDFCVQGAIIYYAKKAFAPAAKVLSPIPDEFKAAAKEYAEENDKLQVFIDEACKIGEPSGDFSVAKSDFVDAFRIFLCAGGHDTSLADDTSLTRAMCLKGFLQKRPGEGNAPLIITLDKKKRGRGFFGIRLKTEAELQA